MEGAHPSRRFVGGKAGLNEANRYGRLNRILEDHMEPEKTAQNAYHRRFHFLKTDNKPDASIF